MDVGHCSQFKDDDDDDDLTPYERKALERLRGGHSGSSNSSVTPTVLPQAQIIISSKASKEKSLGAEISLHELEALQRLYSLLKEDFGDDKGAKKEPELRIDPADGNFYDFADFVDFYGLEAQKQWDSATRIDEATIGHLLQTRQGIGTDGNSSFEGGSSVDNNDVLNKKINTNDVNTKLFDRRLLESVVDKITILRNLAQQLRIERKERRLRMESCGSDILSIDVPLKQASLKPINAQTRWYIKEKVMAHNSSVTCIALAVNNTIVVSGSDCGEVKLWNFPMIEHSGVLLVQEAEAIQCLECLGVASPLVAVAAGDSTITLWDVVRRQQQQKLRGHGDAVGCLACAISFGSSKDTSALLISGSEDKSLKVWETESGTCIQTMKGHHDAVWSVCCPKQLTNGAQNFSCVVSGSWDCTIRVWDFASGKCRYTIRNAHADGVWSVCFVNVHQQLGYGFMSQNPVENLDESIVHEAHLHIASGSWDKTIKIWDIDVTPPALVHTFKDHTFSITDLAAVPGYTLLASSSEDRSLRIWNTCSGECIAALGTTREAHGDGVRCVVALQDQCTLITGGWDKQLIVWQIEE